MQPRNLIRSHVQRITVLRLSMNWLGLVSSRIFERRVWSLVQSTGGRLMGGVIAGSDGSVLDGTLDQLTCLPPDNLRETP